MTTIAIDTAPRRLIWGHPRGLVVVGATELWDRISFHGMQALLVLYMVDQLLLPGHVERIVGFAGFRAAIEAVTGPLSTQALASQIFGLYVGLVYLTPVLGGAIGDRWLGRRRAVSLGALLMTAGHFSLAFDQSFLLALLLLIFGAGFLRGNLLPQVGELYPPDDARRPAAFQLYGSMVNLGAFIAPLVTGLLSKTAGWHPAFAFAGFGMLAGLVIYLAGQRQLAPDRVRGGGGPRTAPRPGGAADRAAALPAGAGLRPVLGRPEPGLEHLQHLGARPCAAADRRLDHAGALAAGARRPGAVPDAAAGADVLGLAGPARTRAGRADEDGDRLLRVRRLDPDPGGRPVRRGRGRAHAAPAADRLPPGLQHRLAVLRPQANALFSRAAPTPVNATMMGVNTLSVFVGSVASGRLGGLYEAWSPAAFWTLHAGVVALAGAILLGLAPIVRRAIVASRRAA